MCEGFNNQLHREREDMPQEQNEISMQCLESKDKGRFNRVNGKHVQLDLRNSTRWREIIVKLGQQRYRETIANFLDWEHLRSRGEGTMKSIRNKQ